MKGPNGLEIPRPIWCEDCDARGVPIPSERFHRQTRIRFFQENAGYATPPGRMICAALLAAAEELGAALGWSVDWQEEQFPDLSWCERCEDERQRRRQPGPHEHTLYAAALTDRRGNWLASLGGIDFGPGARIIGNDPYRRVVEAELMLEAVSS